MGKNKFEITDWDMVESIEPRISPSCKMVTIVFLDGECMTYAYHTKEDMVNAYRQLKNNWLGIGD